MKGFKICIKADYTIVNNSRKNSDKMFIHAQM